MPPRVLTDLEDAVLASAPAALRAVALRLREAILALHPDATIVAWPRQHIISFGFGPKKMTEHHSFIALHAAHVNLGLYQGAQLTSPELHLEGTGKALRHVKVRTTEEASSPAIQRLIREAMQHQSLLLRGVAD